MERSPKDWIAKFPQPGDCFEIGPDRMLRVLIIVEEHVGYKEYGKGRSWMHLPCWTKMVLEAKDFRIVRKSPE